MHHDIPPDTTHKTSPVVWTVALLASVAAPGTVQLLKRQPLTGTLLMVGAAPAHLVAYRAARGTIWADITNPTSVKQIIAAFIISSVIWPAAIIHTYQLFRNGPVRTTAAAFTAAVSAAAFILSAAVTFPQVDVAERTFVNAPRAIPENPTVPNTTHSQDDTPRPTPTDTNTIATGDTTNTTTSDDDTPRRFNLLLLGGDAGAGRYGLRTDSVNLISFDRISSRTVVIGIPRNIVGVPLPSALDDTFPGGYPGLFNEIYQWGTNHPEQTIAAVGNTEEPGASLVASSVAELTGLTVDAWVLVDMAGFVDIVDSLGGVDIYVPNNVPAPGNIPEADSDLPDEFTAGWHTMNGTWALGYSRTRSADSDYWRMGRQRCVLASLAAQTSPVELVTSWRSISEAISRSARTNMTGDQIELLISLRQQFNFDGVYLALTPPTVPSNGWNLDEVRNLVDQAVNTATTPPTSTPAPTDTPSTSPPKTVTSGTGEITSSCLTTR